LRTITLEGFLWGAINRLPIAHVKWALLSGVISAQAGIHENTGFRIGPVLYLIGYPELQMHFSRRSLGVNRFKKSRLPEEGIPRVLLG
jgi:hypothetical protein